MYNFTHIYSFESALTDIDPNCKLEDRIRLGRAIYFATKGSEDGLNIFNRWCRRGDTYKGKKEIRDMWRSFRSDVKDPYPVATIVMMAAEARGIEPVLYTQVLQQENMWNYDLLTQTNNI